jgi:DNA repair exonuclease SbcCD ATPase subunit
MVKRLKEELIQLEPKQIQKKKEVEELIINLDNDTKTVDVERGKLKGDKDLVEMKRNEILKVKEECDTELNKVKPELEKAKVALSVLEEKDIRDLRSYPHPSINVVNLAKNICYVFDVKTEYSDFKTLASDGKEFIRQCQNEELVIKKLNDPRKLRELRKLYALIESTNFTTVSQAAIGLKIWVGALLNYVKPTE